MNQEMNQTKILKRQQELAIMIEACNKKFEAGMVRQNNFDETKRMVESYWAEFTKNHHMLVAAGKKDINYFQIDYYTEIQAIVVRIREVHSSRDGSSEDHIAGAGKMEEVIRESASNDGSQDDTIINASESLKEISAPTYEGRKYIHDTEQFLRNVDEVKSFLEEIMIDDSDYPEILAKEVEFRFDDMQKSFNSNVRQDEKARKENKEVVSLYFNTLKRIKAQITKSERQALLPAPIAKLQEIQIPYFEGGSSEWSSFYDLFKTLVHTNVYISKAEKMQRLKSLLKGSAAKLVSHFNCTESSYDEAWEMLKNRFENERVLFDNLVDTLLDQPKLNSDNPLNIRLLMDTTGSTISSLKKMGLNIDDVKPFIARILIRKFDNEAVQQYEYSVKKTKKIQTLEDVINFLEQMAQAKEAFKRKTYPAISHQKASSRHLNSTEPTICTFCKNKGHKIGECRKFMQLNVVDRRSWANRNKACFICLYHTLDKKCYSSSRKCNKCSSSHHILLHIDNPEATSSSHIARKEKGKSLLATALIRVKSSHGELITLRALIDQGSQDTSISEEAVQLLQLPKKKAPRTDLIGYCGTVVATAKATVNLEIRPRIISNEKFQVEALVLPSTLVGVQPSTSFKYDVSKWDNYCLADPNFNKSDRIDIVIGSDLIHVLLDEYSGARKVDTIVGQKTKLGWILSGVLEKPDQSKRRTAAVTTNLEKFWEMEEVPEINQVSSEDSCIKLFDATTTTTNENRLVVKLPFEEDRDLGESRMQAMARFLNVEKRLTHNPGLRQKYVEFMQEYYRSGHMIKTINNTGKYYLPHQAVIREGSITTKVRVVFDASAKTTNKRSLNDVLKVGPKLQKDIFDIIIKWRLWKNVITADVEKMYRQILISDEDQDYQHILWREAKDQPICEFKLTTVTYGTSSAPYLAKKALAYIGADSTDDNIKNIIINDFYMDDLMTGADTEDECKYIQKEVSIQLGKFGLPLRKWMSNNRKILKTIPNEGNLEVMPINSDETIKTLGLQWHPIKDVFMFSLEKDDAEKFTKRRVLSTLAKIFDPLGWLSPFTTRVKLFIQKLWLIKTEWDELLDDELQKEWKAILESLPILQKVVIPRWYNTKLSTKVTIHGFADASQKAYAAVVYFKIGATLNLVAGKSKVNPIKNRKTLPKLELCAAHLLAKLINRILVSIDRTTDINAWSDSTITLAWITNNKSKDRFIKNKVEEINRLLPKAIWRYVDTKSNPADAASRGVTPEKISNLWWNGPSWLNTDESNWPTQRKQTISLATCQKRCESWLDKLSERFSSYQKLERVIAYVKRFIGKLKKQSYSDWLTSDELKESNAVIIHQHQNENFFTEIQNLKQNKEVDQKSKLNILHPFIDENGILRVGGRIQQSELNYNQKHPIILEKSWLAELIVKKVHALTLHGGNSLVSTSIRREYWIIGMTLIIKKVLKKCVRCIRYGKFNRVQLMGNLPSSRVTVSHPFKYTGVDYAGPILMKCSRGRGQKSFKGYIAVFVCMTTKAIHLEAVSDLTTDAFLAALRRFFSRRGKAACMYSDNGTNFVGAARKLDKEFIEAVRKNSSICEILAAEKIEWHFIPPASPHFGGIWEAGVKSVKHHLRRVIGDSMLTYEEMATLLSQIEAVLNSRPIYAYSECHEGADVLTPGHFLIGRPLIDIPEEINDRNIGSLDRWKIIQKIKRDFWQRWKDEYLVTLQKRYKWRNEMPNLVANQVVIIKDEAAPPSRWPLAKVLETHEGKDGKVRVATLKIQGGILKRPIHKLCPLEFHEEDKKDDRSTSQALHCVRSLEVTTNSISKLVSITLIILMILANSVKTDQIKTEKRIRKLGNGTILYLDKIGTMNRITSSWNLVAYYDMDSYFTTVSQIGYTLERCKSVCRKLREFEEQCSVVLERMEERLQNIKDNDELFAHQSKHRERRAPFEFVGSFYHVLFGTMDADDRRMMEENMRIVLENEHNIKSLAEKQTSVIESTVNILKKTTEEVRTQFENINETIGNISKILNTDYFVYKESINFFMMTKQLEMMVDEAEKVQIQIVGLLIDINHGKINPNLIRPKRLQEEMFKIKEQLSPSLRLPGKTKEVVLQSVYRLMTAKGIFIDGRLVIEVKVPLLERQSSDIFNIMPLPVLKDDVQMQPVIRQQYLVYNYESDVYHLTSQPMLNKCMNEGDDEYLCRSNWAWEDANDQSCELASLKPSNKYHCSYSETKVRSLWMELHERGNWLFRLYEKATAHIVCSTMPQEIIELPMQGILTLESGCTARIGRTTLTSPQEVNSVQVYGFKSHLFKDVRDVEIIKPLNVTIGNYTFEMDALLKEVAAIKAENIKLKSLNWHHSSGHLSLTIIIILIIIFVIIYIRKYCKKDKSVDVIFNLPRQNVQI